MINYRTDINLGQFTEELRDAILNKSKAECNILALIATEYRE